MNNNAINASLDGNVYMQSIKDKTIETSRSKILTVKNQLGNYFALKLFNSDSVTARTESESPAKSIALTEDALNHSTNEITILKHLNKSDSNGHNRLIQSGIADIHNDLSTKGVSYQRQIQVFPLANNNALSLLKTKKNCLRTQLNFLCQSAYCLSEINQCNVIHGDIKLENILIFSHKHDDKQLALKITDFGGSTISTQKKTTKPVFSPTNKAPEYDNTDNDGYITASEKIDIYGLYSCIVIQWLGIETKNINDNNNTHSAQLTKALNTMEHSASNNMVIKVRKNLKALLVEMGNDRPERRPSALEVVSRTNTLLSILNEPKFIIPDIALKKSAPEVDKNTRSSNSMLLNSNTVNNEKNKQQHLQNITIKSWPYFLALTVILLAMASMLLANNNRYHKVELMALSSQELTMVTVCNYATMVDEKITSKLVANCSQIQTLDKAISASQQALQRSPKLMTKEILILKQKQLQFHNNNLKLITLIKENFRLNNKINLISNG